MSKDHYGTLGVDENAMMEQIRKAYRRRAMKVHSDVTQGEDIAERFKELSEAYEMLSDPSKRAAYSQDGDPLDRNGTGEAGDFGGTGFGGFDPSTIMNVMFGGQTTGYSPRSRVQQSQNVLIRAGLKFHEVVFGCMKSVRVGTAAVCPKRQGPGGEPGSKPMTCSTCRGWGEVITVRRSFIGGIRTAQQCPTYQGFGTIVPNPRGGCSGEGRVRSSRDTSVCISAGVSTGNRIHLEGRGEMGHGGGPTGDLYVELVAAKHERFRRDGDNLEVVMTPPMTTTAPGTSVKLTTLEAEWEGSGEVGRKVIIDASTGTQSGTRVPLRG